MKKSIQRAAITAVMAAALFLTVPLCAQAQTISGTCLQAWQVCDAAAQTDAEQKLSLCAGPNEAVQTDAEQFLSLYAASDAIEAAYSATGEHLLTLGTPQVGSMYGEWLVLGLARAGIISDDYVQGYAENAEAYVSENGSAQLSSTKSTENSRVILGLTAIGYDVTDVAGYNLLEPLADLSYVRKQGVNGLIFALIAFDAGGYEIPEAADGATQTTREGLISAILQFAAEDGGFSFSVGGEYDIDITAMALQALTPYYGTDDDVTEAVDAALLLLESVQGGDGYIGDDPCTAAQVITALCTLGIDPVTDERFVKNGLSVMDELLDFYLDDEGGFAYYANGDYNEMATEQAYYALVSYMRLQSGASSLYNMTDTEYSTPSVSGIGSGDETSGGDTGTENDVESSGSDTGADTSGSGGTEDDDTDTPDDSAQTAAGSQDPDTADESDAEGGDDSGSGSESDAAGDSGVSDTSDDSGSSSSLSGSGTASASAGSASTADADGNSTADKDGNSTADAETVAMASGAATGEGNAACQYNINVVIQIIGVFGAIYAGWRIRRRKNG